MGDKKCFLKTVSFQNTTDWNIKHLFNTHSIESRYPFVRIGKNIRRVKNAMKVEDSEQYKRLTIRTNNGGVVVRDVVWGSEIKTKSQYFIQTRQLAVSKIDARNGAFGVVPPEANNAIITGNFWVYDVDETQANMQYLLLIFSSEKFVDAWQNCSNGSGNRLYLQEDKFLQYKIPRPSLEEQNLLIKKYDDAIKQAQACEAEVAHLAARIEADLFDALGIVPEQQADTQTSAFLKTIRFKKLTQWNYEKTAVVFPYRFIKGPANSFSSMPKWCVSLVRGKSPQYTQTSTFTILNQKCNRWDELDLTHAKAVSPGWIKTVDKELFTKPQDILINSTGEGTIGRASLIKNEQHTGLLFDSHMLSLRVNENYIDPQLLVHLINSSFGQKQIELLKGAKLTKQTELGVENMKKMLFPLPAKTVQKEISDHITELKEQMETRSQKAQSLRLYAKKEFENAVFGK